MAYTAISDFKFGMDRRRPQDSGVPGTLWELKNAVITRGGDIERTKKFDEIFSLPAGTFGMFSVRRQRYVFGSATAPSGMPVGVRYQQLAAPSAPAMTSVLDAKGFDGKVYAVAAYADGNVYHFYDGVRVTDWDTLADSAADFTTVAARLASLISAESGYVAQAFGDTVEITAAVAGTAYTIATATTDNDAVSTPTAVNTEIQANVAAVAEVRAAGTVTVTGGTASPGVNRITSVAVDGTELLASPVEWVGSNGDTANALAVEIGNSSVAHGYTASAVGSVVTIKAAAGTGATPNGDVVASTVAGDVTTTDADMSGGVTEVAAVAQVHTVVIGGGSFGATDLWTITLDGTAHQTTGRASATGTSAYVDKSRVFSTAGTLVRYCKINDATDWTDVTPASGAGFINIANESDGADTLVGMAKYENLTAIFARNTIVTYDLQADMTLSGISQTLDNTGTTAPRSIVAYGSNDVYYLDETGVRSLRTRSAINSAYASDIGSALDPFVQSIIAEVGAAKTSKACAVIEATDGRFMLAVGQYVIALSQFPSSSIVAWSYIDFGEDITDMARVDRQICIRAGDKIYAYGGRDGTVYPDDDEFPIRAFTPFISDKDPAGLKMLEGLDMAATGTWRVRIMQDPNHVDSYTDGGTIRGTTYHLPANKLVGQTSHYAVEFVCSSAGFARLSSTAVHHENAEKG